MNKGIKMITLICVIAMISTFIGCTTEVGRKDSLSINEEKDISKNQELEATDQKEQLDINDFDIISFENFERYQENYDEIKVSPYRHRRDDDYTMVDGCWVFAQNEELEYSYLWIDKDMNLVLSVDAEQFRICSDIYEDMTVVREPVGNRKVIIDSKGTNISSKFANVEQGEEILGMWKDTTGVSVWTARVTDTYDSHITELYVKSADGKVKMMWDSKQFPDFCWDDLDELTFANESVYVFGESIVNVTGWSFTHTGGSDTEIWGMDEEGKVYLYEYEYPTNWLVRRTGVGQEQWRRKVTYNGYGQFSDGLIYMRYKGTDYEYQGFVDETGNLAINCELNISNTPIFIDDYAVIELENEAGIKFVTLMNRNGEIMFEPIRGQSVDSLVDTHTEYIGIAEWKHHIAEVDGKLVLLNADGTTADAPVYWREDDAHCLYLNGDYLVIENGMMNKYDDSFSK